VGMATNIPPHNLGEVIDACVALIDNPEQFELVRSRPELIPSLVSEIIRYQTPVLHMRRTARNDVELAGRQHVLDPLAVGAVGERDHVLAVVAEHVHGRRAQRSARAPDVVHDREPGSFGL